VGVVIIEMHLSHKPSCMESGFYSVVCSLCIFVVAVYFLPDGISSDWVLTSLNKWLHYRISKMAKERTVLIVDIC